MLNKLISNLKPEGYSIQINPQTKFLYSTSGSASSIIKHNDALKKLQINIIYMTFNDDISHKTYADLLRAPCTKGGAVTGKKGLKSSIIPYLDIIEPVAKKTCAVNTVVNKNGKLYGYNTDYYGLKTALIKRIKESKIPVRSAVIYGNGGISGVAFHVLQELKIPATIIGRNKANVLKKRKELGIMHIPHFKGPYDLIIDATPVSSDPNFLKNAPGLRQILSNCKIVFSHNMPEKDNKLNYLMKYCSDNNIYFIPGKTMYNAQMIKQFMLYLKDTRPKGMGKITEEDICKAWNLN